MDDRIIHALDLAALAEWDDAKQILEGIDKPIAARLHALFSELQRREEERGRAQTIVRHELGNMLTIAQANVEGMLDGVVGTTPERLSNVRDALESAAEPLQELRRTPVPTDVGDSLLEPFDFASVMVARVDALRGIAATKNVEIGYDTEALGLPENVSLMGNRDAIGHSLFNKLLNAVRFTPPGGAVRIIGCNADGEILLKLHVSAIAKLLNAYGSDARVFENTGEATILALALPFRKGTSKY